MSSVVRSSFADATGFSSFKTIDAELSFRINLTSPETDPRADGMAPQPSGSDDLFGGTVAVIAA